MGQGNTPPSPLPNGRSVGALQAVARWAQAAQQRKGATHLAKKSPTLIGLDDNTAIGVRALVYNNVGHAVLGRRRRRAGCRCGRSGCLSGRSIPLGHRCIRR